MSIISILSTTQTKSQLIDIENKLNNIFNWLDDYKAKNDLLVNSIIQFYVYEKFFLKPPNKNIVKSCLEKILKEIDKDSQPYKKLVEFLQVYFPNLVPKTINLEQENYKNAKYEYTRIKYEIEIKFIKEKEEAERLKELNRKNEEDIKRSEDEKKLKEKLEREKFEKERKFWLRKNYKTPEEMKDVKVNSMCIETFPCYHNIRFTENITFEYNAREIRPFLLKNRHLLKLEPWITEHFSLDSKIDPYPCKLI
jgi:hypothetical protein